VSELSGADAVMVVDKVGMLALTVDTAVPLVE
jgi:hypothetical protein